MLILSSSCYGMQNAASKLLGYLQRGTSFLRTNAAPMAKWAGKNIALPSVSAIGVWAYLHNLLFVFDQIFMSTPSDETAQLVQQVQHQMEMDNWNIRVRRTPHLSRTVKQLLRITNTVLPVASEIATVTTPDLTLASPDGKHTSQTLAISLNLAEIITTLLANTLMATAYSRTFPHANTIVLNERWMNKLTLPEKRFVIAHELAHIRHRHSYKAFPPNVIMSSLLGSIARTAVKSDSLAARLIRNQLQRRGTELLAHVLSRSHEYEADTTAARTLGAGGIDGGIAFFTRMENKRINPSTSILKNMLRTKQQIYERIGLSTHPSHTERIANLERLRQ